MKILRKSLCGALFIFSAVALASCNEQKKPEPSAPEVEKYTVTFETNGGSAVASQEIEKGKFATKPEDPTKESYSFTGWFKESTTENTFEFATEAINQDTTIYAGWISSSSAITAKFLWNYNGSPSEVYKTVPFEDNTRISKPEDPKREGYEFAGWYTSTDYTTEFSKAKKYSGNQMFYAKWLKVFTMEAEHTQLTGIPYSIALDGVVSQNGDKKGSNFSGNVQGLNLIREDSGASGGKFVWGCLNLEEGYLDFEFTADKADSQAKLTIVVSAEFWGFTVTPESFKILVNPESNDDDSVNYSSIDLTFVEWSTSSTAHPTWISAYINVINVQQGKNVIRLLVNNDTSNTQGTIKAQGPIVDCIKISTSSELQMTKYNV